MCATGCCELHAVCATGVVLQGVVLQGVVLQGVVLQGVVLRAPRLFLCSSVFYFGFPLSVSFHHCCTLTLLHHSN